MAQQPPSGPRPRHFRGFIITLRPTTLGRTPLDEWSARRRDLYLTTHYNNRRQTYLHPAGFEPTIPACQRPLGSACCIFNLKHLHVLIYCTQLVTSAYEQLPDIVALVSKCVGVRRSIFVNKYFVHLLVKRNINHINRFISYRFLSFLFHLRLDLPFKNTETHVVWRFECLYSSVPAFLQQSTVTQRCAGTWRLVSVLLKPPHFDRIVSQLHVTR